MFWTVQTASEAKFLIPLFFCNNGNKRSAVYDKAHVIITQEERNSLDAFENDNMTFNHEKIWWRLGSQRKRGIVLLAAILASVMIMLFSRLVSANKPGDNHSRECTLLWYYTTCVNCGMKDITTGNDDVDCCMVPLCQHGFRGLPMIFSFLLLLPLTWLLSKALNAWWLLVLSYRRGGFLGYSTLCDPNNAAEESGSDDHSRDEEDVSAEQKQEDIDNLICMDDTSTIQFHWERRPPCSYLWRYLPAGLVFDGIIEKQDAVVVAVCGPSNLVQTVKQELAQDPIQKRWTVVVAAW